MKALVATAETQGMRYYDEMTCIEGELVFIPEACPKSESNPDGCSCARIFVGMYSNGGTTTAVVRDIVGLTRKDYAAAMKSSHDNTGCPGSFDAYYAADQLIRRAERWPAGSVIGRRLDRLDIRATLAA